LTDPKVEKHDIAKVYERGEEEKYPRRGDEVQRGVHYCRVGVLKIPPMKWLTGYRVGGFVFYSA